MNEIDFALSGRGPPAPVAVGADMIASVHDCMYVCVVRSCGVQSADLRKISKLDRMDETVASISLAALVLRRFIPSASQCQTRGSFNTYTVKNNISSKIKTFQHGGG